MVERLYPPDNIPSRDSRAPCPLDSNAEEMLEMALQENAKLKEENEDLEETNASMHEEIKGHVERKKRKLKALLKAATNRAAKAENLLV